MSAAEESLKKRVVSVLRSPACMSIQFTYVGSTVMGYGYGYVADVIEKGGIQIKIRDTGSFTAGYDHRGSTPTFTFSNADPEIVSSPEGSATIVHEATHAVIDAVRKGRTIAFGDNEVAAYLAETIYRINSNAPLTGPLAPLLNPVARRIKSFRGPGVYVVTADEVVQARAFILSVYAARARQEGKTLPGDEMMKGLAPPPPAMVPDP
jgi:hypothetical protein